MTSEAKIERSGSGPIPRHPESRSRPAGRDVVKTSDPSRGHPPTQVSLAISKDESAGAVSIRLVWVAEVGQTYLGAPEKRHLAGRNPSLADAGLGGDKANGYALGSQSQLECVRQEKDVSNHVGSEYDGRRSGSFEGSSFTGVVRGESGFQGQHRFHRKVGATSFPPGFDWNRSGGALKTTWNVRGWVWTRRRLFQLSHREEARRVPSERSEGTRFLLLQRRWS